MTSYKQGRGNILYLSGWFQPMIITGGVIIPSSRPNGILHVSLSGVAQNVSIANNLIAYGPVEVLNPFTITSYRLFLAHTKIPIVLEEHM